MKSTREKALLILNDVLYKGAFLEESLEILKKSRIDERDYNFVKEITTGVVRNRSYLDYVIKINSKIIMLKQRQLTMPLGFEFGLGLRQHIIAKIILR